VNDLDAPTLMLASAVVTTLVTVVFATITVTRHTDPASRWWTAAFVSASTLTLLTIVWGTGESVPTAVAAAVSATATLTVGAIWVGVTLLATCSSRAIEITAAATAVSVGGWVVVGIGADRRVGICIAAAAIASLAACAAISQGWRPMQGSINTRILQASLGVTAALSAGRAVSFAVSGHQAVPNEVTVIWFSLLMTICAICLSAVRVERHGTWWAISDEPAERAHHGLIPEAAFRRELADRVERSAMVGDTPAVILVTIADLAEINEAFGRSAGDGAIGYVTQVMRSRLPSSALLGHLGANRLVASLAVSARRPTSVIEAALHTALLETELPSGLPVRVRCTIRSVVSAPHRDVDNLLLDLTKVLSDS
jgi:GGDEF domain-containing protein